MNNQHIEAAIEQAKKEGNKGVRGFVGGIDEHNEYTKLLNEGMLEIFIQKYTASGYELTCQLMRKPKKK